MSSDRSKKKRKLLVRLCPIIKKKTLNGGWWWWWRQRVIYVFVNWIINVIERNSLIRLLRPPYCFGYIVSFFLSLSRFLLLSFARSEKEENYSCIHIDRRSAQDKLVDYWTIWNVRINWRMFWKKTNIMGCVSSKKKLSKADLDFLQENTEFTKDQIIEWYEGFIVSILRVEQIFYFSASPILSNCFFFQQAAD